MKFTDITFNGVRFGRKAVKPNGYELTMTATDEAGKWLVSTKRPGAEVKYHDFYRSDATLDNVIEDYIGLSNIIAEKEAAEAR
jgi:hypothetical protein